MPWLDGTKGKIEFPSHYAQPQMAAAYNFDCGDLNFAKKKRAFAATAIQDLKELQKRCAKQKDFEAAKFLSSEAKYFTKVQRGWDFVVKVLEGDTDYHTKFPQSASEETAKYIDAAFDAVVFQEKQEGGR